MNDTVGGASSQLRKSDWGSRQAGVKLLCCLSPSGGHVLLILLGVWLLVKGIGLETRWSWILILHSNS